MRVLVGDIGGTKTTLAVAEVDGGDSAIRLDPKRRYPSREFSSLGDLIARFFEETAAQCEFGSFAVAGPVVEDSAKTTNLPWEVDARALEARAGFRRVRLLNDLEAVAWGIGGLDERALAVLQPGEPDASGNACVVAAGTGLGQAGLFWDGTAHRPFPTEGGHCDFAPVDERELALLQHLKARFGRVSWERVVSGMGIANIYGFLLEWHDAAPSPEIGAVLAEDGDVAAAVAGAADGCPICRETMDMFATFYGREAGNTALKHMALGGVYLGGGIAPKNLDLLRRPGFTQGFLDKGRMQPLMSRMPVKVILEPTTPLLGATRFMIDS
jgi:glucokinase